MNCQVCGSEKIKLIYKNYPGYVGGARFNIFECEKCDTHFIHLNKIPKELYELIYSNLNTPSYRRYYKYAGEVKKHKNPLKFLADMESTYFPVYNYVKNKKNLDVLEIGCGFGYITYALNKLGHNTTGIDISKKAIYFANNNFGNYFINIDAENFSKKNNRKFDLVLGLELIEHLNNPNNFIKTCLRLLKKDGKIILTSPNKDYIKTAIWQTDLPPVHIFWSGHKGFEKIAENNKLKVEFVDFKNYFPKDWNNLINFAIIRKENPIPIMDERGKINGLNGKNSVFFKKIMRKILIEFVPVRFISNKIHNTFVKEYPTLGIILSRN